MHRCVVRASASASGSPSGTKVSAAGCRSSIPISSRFSLAAQAGDNVCVTLWAANLGEGGQGRLWTEDMDNVFLSPAWRNPQQSEPLHCTSVKPALFSGRSAVPMRRVNSSRFYLFPRIADESPQMNSVNRSHPPQTPLTSPFGFDGVAAPQAALEYWNAGVFSVMEAT